MITRYWSSYNSIEKRNEFSVISRLSDNPNYPLEKHLFELYKLENKGTIEFLKEPYVYSKNKWIIVCYTLKSFDRPGKIIRHTCIYNTLVGKTKPFHEVRKVS